MEIDGGCCRLQRVVVVGRPKAEGVVLGPRVSLGL